MKAWQSAAAINSCSTRYDGGYSAAVGEPPRKSGRRSSLSTKMQSTRNGANWTARFPRLAAGLASLPCESAIVDAELDIRTGLRPCTAPLTSGVKMT
jgi:hypothetical protein